MLAIWIFLVGILAISGAAWISYRFPGNYNQRE